MEDAVEEILLRVPPDEPAHLVRAALVCKAWRRTLSDRGFLRRYRGFHRAPPLLGYLHSLYHETGPPIPAFVPTTEASPIPPLPLDGGSYWARDCRHGRVLLQSFHQPQRLLVWDPITGDRKELSAPAILHTTYAHAGAVLCTIDGCDHLDCRGGPFLVVFVWANASDGGDGLEEWATTYSSETGVWRPSVSIVIPNFNHYIAGKQPCPLIGDALYFTLRYGLSILRYDLGGHRLSVIELPPRVFGRIVMKVEDGVMGLVAMSNNCIYKWLWQVNANGGTGGWEKNMVMELKTLLPWPARRTRHQLIAHVEGTDTIFIRGARRAGVFTLDLKSRKVKKVGEEVDNYPILPYTSFYTPDLVKGQTVSTMTQ
ncbi:uncharacterized protein LOC120659091 [Panicum virgatum]|nr:uncharacterized protein LOC120659091 [Panicum virgatum]